MGNRVKQSALVTLEANALFNFTSGTPGFGVTLASSVFNRFNQMASEYRWYEMESHRIVIDYDNVASQQNLATFAFYPTNYKTEASLALVPTNSLQLDGLPGAVQLQPQSTNKGRWVPTGLKYQFSCADATFNNPVFGTLMGYMNLKSGATTVSAGISLSLNVRFYGARFNTVTQSLPPLVVNPITEESDEEVVEIVSRKRVAK